MTGFTLDWMHTVDGGILKKAVAYLFVVGKKVVPVHIATQYPSELIVEVNTWIRRWSKCMPMEFSRRPRSLDEIDKWKMRETSMTATLVIPALTCVSTVWRHVVRAHFIAFLKLVVFCRLIGGFSMRKVRDADIDLAERLVKEYLEYIQKGGDHISTVPYVSHSAIHLPDECHHHGGLPLGNISAYPFENFIKYFRMVRTKMPA